MDIRSILLAYNTGAVSRSAAMLALGLDWYGDLLVMLSQHHVARPQVSGRDALVMDEALKKALG